MTLPIKILGFPRSGTSLLQQLLGSHKDVYAPPETYIFSGCAKMIRESRGEGPDLGMVTGLSFAGFEPEDVIDRVRAFGFSFMQEGAAKAGKSTWSEKSAFDIFDLPEIETLLAGHCRFVCVVRNPLDVVASMKDLSDRMGQQVPQMLPWTARYESYYLAWARAWVDLTEALLDLHDRLGERSLLYRYEDLIEDPAAVLARITDFAGLSPFDAPAKLGGTQIGLGDWKISTSRDINKSSVARWRRSLPKSSARTVLDAVAPLMDRLGYEKPVIRAPQSRDERVVQFKRAKQFAIDLRRNGDKS